MLGAAGAGGACAHRENDGCRQRVTSVFRVSHGCKRSPAGPMPRSDPPEGAEAALPPVCDRKLLHVVTLTAHAAVVHLQQACPLVVRSDIGSGPAARPFNRGRVRPRHLRVAAMRGMAGDAGPVVVLEPSGPPVGAEAVTLT